nr:Chain C, Peptide 23-652 [synthetic construct]
DTLTKSFCYFGTWCQMYGST